MQDSFQIVRIDPRVTQFLEASEMFIAEQKSGMPLFRVRTALSAHDTYIAVEQGEVVAQVEERPEAIVAVMINDGRGLVPRTALEPFKGP
jgi:hypothetical protein